MRAIPCVVGTLLTLTGVLTGCASTSGGEVDTAECVAVEVRNNYSALHSVEAFVLTRASPPLRLGSVRPGSRRTFLFRPRNVGAPHQLHVRFLGKEWEITSPDFAPVPEQILIWDVGSNHLRRDERPDVGLPSRCR